MRPVPPSSIAAALTLLVAGRAASAQTAAARCAPTIELGESLPPRVAQRLRRVLDGAVDGIAPTAPCAPSRARLEWNDHELTVRIALDDGRIAVRNLESLEDVLPTLLSVLAVPPPDPHAAPDAEPVAPPAPAPPEAPVAAVVVAPPAPLPPAPRALPSPSGWSLLVSVHGGASVQEGGGAMARWGGEVGAASPRLALTVRAATAYDLDHSGGARNDAPTPSARRRRPADSGLVLSARARLGAGRLRVEVGGFGGLAHDASDDPSRWLPRLGLEASLNWQIVRSVAAFARVEGYADVGGDRGPGVALTVGGTWEPQR